MPAWHSEKLHAIAASTLGPAAELHTVRGAGHNDCFEVGGGSYLAALKR